MLSVVQRGTRPAGIPFGKSLSRKLLLGQEREQSQGLQGLGRHWVWGGDIGVTAWGTRMLFSRDRATLLHVHGVSKCTNLGKGSCWGVDCKGKGPVPVFGDVSPKTRSSGRVQRPGMRVSGFVMCELSGEARGWRGEKRRSQRAPQECFFPFCPLRGRGEGRALETTRCGLPLCGKVLPRKPLEGPQPDSKSTAG